MQIESVSFKNFKVLRDTTLPLSRMTLLIGPNGSGKSTALEGLDLLRRAADSRLACDPETIRTLGAQGRSREEPPSVAARWSAPHDGWTSRIVLERTYSVQHGKENNWGGNDALKEALIQIRQYAFDAQYLRQPCELQPTMELARNGFGLAVVLDRLRDEHPERFERLNAELPLWFPEYDRVLFETPSLGARSIALRLSSGAGKVPAGALSEGTLVALAMLTLANLGHPPVLICMEEPDRGVHPRLLKNVHEALTRLAYPESACETRPPVQVLVTTHSPYFLDLFKDHPEEVVIAERENGEAKFHRLTDRPDIKELLEDASLGEIWYSGALGGVPSGR